MFNLIEGRIAARNSASFLFVIMRKFLNPEPSSICNSRRRLLPFWTPSLNKRRVCKHFAYSGRLFLLIIPNATSPHNVTWMIRHAKLEWTQNTACDLYADCPQTLYLMSLGLKRPNIANRNVWFKYTRAVKLGLNLHTRLMQGLKNSKIWSNENPNLQKLLGWCAVSRRRVAGTLFVEITVDGNV
jgi:hypothetical protein